MLMYQVAKRVVEKGREAFFPKQIPDLPKRRSLLLQRDDLAPQFGFVGSSYAASRVLLLGINPGNGGNNSSRIPADARMMPAILRFAECPDQVNFLAAEKAYMAECRDWVVWKRHCSEVMGAGKLSFDDIAYSNCLPWRTESRSKFSEEVAKRTAELFVRPLIEELKPRLIIALGKTRVPEILNFTGLALPPVIKWNRSQALTESAKHERAAAATEVLRLAGRSPNTEEASSN